MSCRKARISFVEWLARGLSRLPFKQEIASSNLVHSTICPRSSIGRALRYERRNMEVRVLSRVPGSMAKEPSRRTVTADIERVRVPPIPPFLLMSSKEGRLILSQENAGSNPVINTKFAAVFDSDRDLR